MAIAVVALMALFFGLTIPTTQPARARPAANAPAGYLTEADLLEIAVGVVGDVTVRDRGLLASAISR